ncbi:MAG: hypothetical protein ABI923_09105 [bacterium]
MRYLLGDLAEDEKARMEEAFFADDAKFDELELAEDELIDAYVRNELSPEQQRQFEAKSAKSPRLLERVNFARALAEKADSLSSPESEPSIEPARSFSSRAAPKTRWWGGFFAQQPAFRTAMAACCVLILVVGIVLVSGWWRRRSEPLASEEAASQRQKEELQRSTNLRESPTPELQQSTNLREPPSQELQRSTNLKEPTNRQPVRSTFATVFLTPGSLRSGDSGQSKLTIGSGTTTARVHLALEKNDYRTYSAQVKTADGKVVFRKSGLRPHNTGSDPRLLLSVPARSLTPGDYIVHVDGVTTSGQVEGVNDYPFRVVTEQ